MKSVGLEIIVFVISGIETKAKYIIDNGLYIVAEKGKVPNTTLQSDYKSRPPLIDFLDARRFLSLWKVRCLRSRGRNFRPGSDYSRRGTINSQFENQPSQPTGSGSSGSGGKGERLAVGDTVAASCNPRVGIGGWLEPCCHNTAAN